MKKMFVVVMIIALLLLVACKPMDQSVSEKPVDDKPIDKAVESVPVSGNNDISQDNSGASGVVSSSSGLEDKSVAAPSVSGDCTPSWKCIGAFNKAHLTADCKWKENTKCKYGCLDGECKKPPVCDAGFKCRTDKVYGYESEGCYWSKEEMCELGCKDNACVKPITPAVSANTAQKEDPYAVENKTTGCTEGWKCADADYSVHQDSYCTLSQKSYCANGCAQGKCVK